MVISLNKLFLIGMGPGDESLYSNKIKQTLGMANRVLCTRDMSLVELMRELRNPDKGDTAVLLSGDCGFFSISKSIITDFSSFYQIELIPGISSISYLSAKIKVSYDDAVLVSLHGRDINIVSKVAYNKKVFALTGGENDVRDICRTLCRCRLGDVSVCVGERLSYPDERIIKEKASVLKDMAFDKLSVIFIENTSAVNPHSPIYDNDFIRSEIPMTKEEVRWLSIRKLGVAPYDIVFDIGAGTGSVSIEMARKAFDGFVYAIEKNEDACCLVLRNAALHGAYNIDVIHGEAPDALEKLPVPDKAFIGGSSNAVDVIVEKLVSLNPNIRITATSITLQTLHKLTESFKKYGVTGTDIICVNIAKAKKTGKYDMMVAQNPVYIITGEAQCAIER